MDNDILSSQTGLLGTSEAEVTTTVTTDLAHIPLRTHGESPNLFCLFANSHITARFGGPVALFRFAMAKHDQAREVKELSNSGAAADGAMLARRDVLVGAVALAASIAFKSPVTASGGAGISASPKFNSGGKQMGTITVKDGTTIYYKDWGKGPAVTFSHGWPLNSDAWDGQMLFLAQHGYRCVGVDRRGHGRSSQPSTGNDMDGYADDLAAVIEALDLKNATLIGHSTGGGEVARYVGRHGSKRVAAAVLVAAVPPIMLKTAVNPEGLPMEVFDGIRAGVAGDRSQFYKDLAVKFYGANRPGAKVSQGVLDQFWLWSMQAGALNAYECVKAFSETDFNEDLRKFDFPTLVLHGEDDQIVPVKDSARKSAKLIKGAKEIYYPGAPHGLTATHQDRVNADLLAFLQDSVPASTQNQGHRRTTGATA